MESQEPECNFKIESRIKFVNQVANCQSSAACSAQKDNIALLTLEKLKNKLHQDIKACDLLWSLFISALLSYRRDTVLRPCPPNFSGIIDNGLFDRNQKNFDRMVRPFL